VIHCFSSILTVARKYIKLSLKIIYKARGSIYSALWIPLALFEQKTQKMHALFGIWWLA